MKIYNSLSNQIEEFKPLREGKVSIYVCGPTVYNYVHVGNLRPVVVFDVFRRLLMHLGYDVTFISNFTDIDDKVIAQAQKEGLSEKEIAEKYIKAFEQNREDIHALKPTYQPRVTEVMDKIIDFIKTLLDKGYAYQTKSGDVYFRVHKIKDYGCLSNMKADDLMVGARVEENDEKENPYDFALWKMTDVGIKFDSPFGKGRPGWHSECVVMINSLIEGGRIDVHGGGSDLKFPHHENEIAQEEAYYGHKIATYWMHNGFINIDGVKMSKSLGNVILAKDYLEKLGGNVVRFMLLNTHYRLPVNFNEELVESSKASLERIESSYRKLCIEIERRGEFKEVSYDEDKLNKFVSSLEDDLNTANAISELYQEVKEINILLRNKNVNLDELNKNLSTLEKMLSLLGLEFERKILSKEDLELLQKYDEAKAKKDFATSDELRNILIEKKLL